MIRTLREQVTPTSSRSVKIAFALALLSVLFVGFTARPALASTFTVESAGDGPDATAGDNACATASSECTLRAAIEEANANSNLDTIEFNLPGSGLHTIAPASALPAIVNPVFVDGYSQGGGVGTPTNPMNLNIELNGTGAGQSVDGLEIETANSTVRGLIVDGWNGRGIVISGSGATGNKVEGNCIGLILDCAGAEGDPEVQGNASDGVLVDNAPNNTVRTNVISANGAHGVYIFGDGAQGNKVEGNHIGTDETGAADLGNTQSGVIIDNSPNNTIGGTTVEARNIISGNGASGVDIYGTGAKGNKVEGNHVGTDETGAEDLGNSNEGVTISGAPNNTVGGAVTPSRNPRNVISGNDGNGVGIYYSNAKGNKVEGNYVGTDANGTADLGNSYEGVAISGAPNNTVGGSVASSSNPRNVISGNDTHGIFIGGTNATGNKVEGNYIGTDLTGTQELGNSYEGVAIPDASSNTIGGAVAGARNIISGNGEHGIYILGAGAKFNLVRGNYIGTDKNGTADLGNSQSGVYIQGAPNNTVGGTRNIISGNDDNGVHISGAGAKKNQVRGNRLGTNAAGTQDLGNSYAGVYVNAPNNTIGGAVSSARNLVSGNDAFGVYIYYAKDNQVQGNYVGTNAAGTQKLGNGTGVIIQEAPNNMVGGTGTGTGNVVSGSGGPGIYVLGFGATGNRILSTSIYGNGGLGIDLSSLHPPDGVTSNDNNDTDTGPNRLQNFPSLTSVANSGGKTTIQGKLDSIMPNRKFIIQFFSSPQPDPSDHGEGQKFLGQKIVTTNNSGKVAFSFTANPAVTVGSVVSATATDNTTFDTSEFSKAVVVPDPCSVGPVFC